MTADLRQVPTLPRLRPCRYVPAATWDMDRGAVCLALAQLAHRRPGWLIYLREVADRLPGGGEMFDGFLKLERGEL